jgi:hypothetical protein
MLEAAQYVNERAGHDGGRGPMEPITELRPVHGPVVYGYLRLPGPNQSRRTALAAALRGYCDHHELILGGIYTDSGRDSGCAPGFTSLLDAVLATGGYGVIVPSPAHLGAGQFAARRSDAIIGVGRRLIVLRGAVASTTVRWRHC